MSRSINQVILSFSPPDYQAAVARGEAALPIITPTDLRHNVGHSLAMQGVSAEEIAHILGHTSLTVAKYYILATPALALIRAKALGTNPVWQNMVAMMLTGELTSSTKWQGQRVVGIIGDQLHDGIGGCSRDNGDCPFSEVRCCYGCLYYRPFTDGDHQAVLESVVKEVDELISISDSVGNARNPLISIHETTQFEIQSVIARCRFRQEKSGWLRGNGKNKLRFDEISRTKGIEGRHAVAEDYARFMKALLVLVYRRRNRSISPAVAVATLMILKRWYHSLFEMTGQTHPVYLTTGVIQRSMDSLSAASSPGDPNTANYKGRCVSLQKMVNHQSFTLVTLQYVSDAQYTNQTNLTRKARETMALKQQDKLTDTTTDGEEALITIRGFLNIVELIQRVESDAEKIALNCLLLLVITGFRSIEAFNLRQDALFKRQIDDPAIRKRFQDKGLPDYFLGIRYIGVKGAGERTHWAERSPHNFPKA